MEPETANSMTPFNVWEFGLSIGVIACSFAGIYYLFNHFATTTKEQSQSFRQTVKELSSEHKSERDEWRQDSNRREERIVSVCDELIKTIHETKSK